jgi:hypothetical protein
VACFAQPSALCAEPAARNDGVKIPISLAAFRQPLRLIDDIDIQELRKR